MVIALEGLPGAGKTTVAGLLENRLAAAVVRETTMEHPFLSQVYDETDRDDLTVELSFLVLHANPYRRLDRTKLTVCDFSPAKDELFAEDMLSGDELRLFREIYARVYRGIELPDVAVYLRAEPELCLERGSDRMRRNPDRGFEEGLTIERLRRMGQRYEEGLNRLGRTHLVYEVQGSLSAEAVADDLTASLRAAITDAGYATSVQSAS